MVTIKPISKKFKNAVITFLQFLCDIAIVFFIFKIIQTIIQFIQKFL